MFSVSSHLVPCPHLPLYSTDTPLLSHLRVVQDYSLFWECYPVLGKVSCSLKPIYIKVGINRGLYGLEIGSVRVNWKLMF